MGEYVDSHIATRAYLQAWTSSQGHLVRVPLGHGKKEGLRNPRSVGKRSHFFENQAVAEVAEETLNRYETRAAPVLKDLKQLWPLSDEQRWALACLMGIHIYRNPAGRGRISELSAKELNRRSLEYVATMSTSQLQSFYREVTDERFLVNYMLETIPKTAALI